MSPNEGSLDRILRVGAGLVLMLLAGVGAIGPWGWVGAVPLATGLVGWCPLYRVLGISTCGLQR